MLTLHLLVREHDADVTADEGEDDGLHPVAVETVHQDVLETTISSNKIRNVHPRKYGKSGTRIVFENGAAIVVSNLYPDVVNAWKADVAAA